MYPTNQQFKSLPEYLENMVIKLAKENWNSWKNEGCPSFVKERASDTKPTRVVRKRAAPEDFLGKGPNKKILIGNEELTRLWNLCPDNMEACKSETREYMPTLEEFFEEAIEQADPENIAIGGVTESVCTASTPFVLLGDVLDCLPLDQCDTIFTFVEKNVATWKSNTFYSAGKNYLLRMCNDLLRRLSKSQNTVFCGRIQLFLARLFPLSEKSGLNLQSQFNLENVTVFNTNEQESTLGQKHTEDREEGMDVEEGEMGDDEAPTTCSIPIDYNLYRKFWSLQDYFRNPVQCYEKISWKTFLKYSEEVLAVFKSYKLDDTQASRKKMEELKTGGEHVYFAKFLTSEKLMDLQLSDSNFRRHILLQYLILFQYLKGQVKFKSSNYVLTDEQIESFANKLGEQWKILAPYLEIKDSDIRQIECDSEDMKMRAKQLLVAWQDQEGVHATTDNLISALNKSGLSDLAESLTNDTETNS